MGSTGGRGEPASGWHRQDWLVCIEALVALTDPEAATPKQRRAWQLVETIAAACEIDPTAYIFEIDDSWGPETALAGSADAPEPVSSFRTDDWQLLETALKSFADNRRHTKRGQRACQLAAAIDSSEQPTVGH